MVKKKTLAVVTDDLDGSSKAVRTVAFGIEGVSYEVNLGPASFGKLAEALAPFLAVARKRRGQHRRGSRSTTRLRPALRDTWRRLLLNPLWFASTGFVVAALLVVVAGALFIGSDAETFQREVAKLTLQLALIVVFSALIKLIFDYYVESRARAAQKLRQQG
jgi:hypothetical protein